MTSSYNRDLRVKNESWIYQTYLSICGFSTGFSSFSGTFFSLDFPSPQVAQLVKPHNSEKSSILKPFSNKYSLPSDSEKKKSYNFSKGGDVAYNFISKTEFCLISRITAGLLNFFIQSGTTKWHQSQIYVCYFI